MHLDNIPTQCEEERNGVLGNALIAGRGDVTNRDLALFACIQVNHIRADGHNGNEFEVGALVECRCCDRDSGNGVSICGLCVVIRR